VHLRGGGHHDDDAVNQLEQCGVSLTLDKSIEVPDCHRIRPALCGGHPRSPGDEG
jgi:hypothetical protein